MRPSGRGLEGRLHLDLAPLESLFVLVEGSWDLLYAALDHLPPDEQDRAAKALHATVVAAAAGMAIQVVTRVIDEGELWQGIDAAMIDLPALDPRDAVLLGHDFPEELQEDVDDLAAEQQTIAEVSLDVPEDVIRPGVDVLICAGRHGRAVRGITPSLRRSLRRNPARYALVEVPLVVAPQTEIGPEVERETELQARMTAALSQIAPDTPFPTSVLLAVSAPESEPEDLPLLTSMLLEASRQGRLELTEDGQNVVVPRAAMERGLDALVSAAADRGVDRETALLPAQGMVETALVEATAQGLAAGDEDLLDRLLPHLLWRADTAISQPDPISADLILALTNVLATRDRHALMHYAGQFLATLELAAIEEHEDAHAFLQTLSFLGARLEMIAREEPDEGVAGTLLSLARSCFERGLAIASRAGADFRGAQVAMLIHGSDLAGTPPEERLRMADEAVAVAEVEATEAGGGWRGTLATALNARARALLAAGQGDAAMATYERALGVVGAGPREAGLAFAQVLTLLALGDLLQERGDTAEARQRLWEANTTAQQMAEQLDDEMMGGVAASLLYQATFSLVELIRGTEEARQAAALLRVAIRVCRKHLGPDDPQTRELEEMQAQLDPAPRRSRFTRTGDGPENR